MAAHDPKVLSHTTKDFLGHRPGPAGTESYPKNGAEQSVKKFQPGPNPRPTKKAGTESYPNPRRNREV